MLQRLHHRTGHYVLLLAVGAALFLVNLGGPALWDMDEGLNAAAAVEMRESGNWIVPTFNGKLRSHKPPLLYWLQVIAYSFFGINEFAARLPSALAALGTLLLVYELGRGMFNPTTGLFGGLILASSALFCASAHFANPDALLLLFTTATLLFSWRAAGFIPAVQTAGINPAARSSDRIWFLLTGAAAGLATLAKGPVGVALPLLVVGVYLVWSRSWPLLFDRRWLQASLVFALVALPWYIQVGIDTKLEFLRDFLRTHNLDRALRPMESHSGPPFYYVVVLLLGLLPWSVFLGSAAWYGSWSAIRLPWCRLRGTWSIARDAEQGEADQVNTYRFLWCWIAVYFLVFTVAATKLPNYILPVCPPLALLTARLLDRWRRGVLVLPGWLHACSVALLTLLGFVTVVGLLVLGGTIEVPWLRGRSWPGLETWAFLGAVPVCGAAAAAWCLRQQQRAAFLVVIFVAALGFVGPLAAGGSMALDHFRAPRPLVHDAGALQRDQEIRVGCYQLEHLPSLNFYVQRHVQHLKDPEVLAFLNSPLPSFLFLPRNDWERLAGSVTVPHRVVGPHREMYRVGEVVVVTNR